MRIEFEAQVGLQFLALTMAEPTKEEWKAVSDLLKAALLGNEIPVEPREMKPKVVWKKCKDSKHPAIQCVDYDNKQIRDKFTRILRSKRSKHKDGDLENEGKKVIVWKKSAAKQFLKLAFREKTIPTDYIDSEWVWQNHCSTHPAFKRLKFDAAFTRRLDAVREDYIKKVSRCETDLEAYKIAKRNHPTPEFNCRGEPQWNGSEAQKRLKEIVSNGEHDAEGVSPKTLWESDERFQAYSLPTFRDHIYQEKRLLKFDYYLELLKQKKADKLQY